MTKKSKLQKLVSSPNLNKKSPPLQLSTAYPHGRATLTSPRTVKNPFILYTTLLAHAVLVYGFVSSIPERMEAEP